MERVILRVIDEDTMEVDRQGIFTPRGTRIVAQNDDYLVIKLPGHGYHSGQGRPQAYAPAEFELYHQVGEVGDGRLEGRVALRWPVRS